MNAKHNKIEAILGYLSNELLCGFRFLSTAKILHNAYSKQQLTCAGYFFAAAYEACLRESLMSLSKITTHDQDSITIDYLLNCVLQAPQAFPRATKSELQRLITEHREQLATFQPLVENIKVQRNRILAHLDRKHISNPTAVFAESIDMSEVEQCFGRLLQIINAYKNVFDSSELCLESIGDSIQKDVTYLVQLMQSTDTPRYD